MESPKLFVRQIVYREIMSDIILSYVVSVKILIRNENECTTLYVFTAAYCTQWQGQESGMNNFETVIMICIHVGI